LETFHPNLNGNKLQDLFKQSQFEGNHESEQAEDNLNPTVLVEEVRGISIELELEVETAPMATSDAEISDERDLIEVDDDHGVHQSSRNRKPGRLFREGFWVTYATEMDNKYDDEQSYEILSPRRFDYEWKYVYASRTNPDTMYRHEAMKEPDRDQF
jgi:hypothetical protein